MIVRYAVRNQEGKWFRSKGYGGYGDTWTEDTGKARLYGTLAQARARRTFFTTEYPEYGAPDIVKFECEGVRINDDAQLNKAVKKKATKKERAAAAKAKWDLKLAEERFAIAEAALRRVKDGI